MVLFFYAMKIDKTFAVLNNAMFGCMKIVLGWLLKMLMTSYALSVVKI